MKSLIANRNEKRDTVAGQEWQIRTSFIAYDGNIWPFKLIDILESSEGTLHPSRISSSVWEKVNIYLCRKLDKKIVNYRKIEEKRIPNLDNYKLCIINIGIVS